MRNELKEPVNTKKGIEYAPQYEDLPSSDILWTYAQEETVGRRPRATAWFKDFRVLATATVMAEVTIISKRSNRALHTMVRRRSSRRT